MRTSRIVAGGAWTWACVLATACTVDVAVDGADEHYTTQDGALIVLPNVIAHVPCLDYDGISNDAPGDPYVLPVSSYATQMKWLKDNGYTPLTLQAWLAKLNDPAFPDNGYPAKPVLLFSDTTAQSFAANAVPILDKYAFKATLGIEAGLLGQSWAMTPATLSGLQAKGFEIASHSWTHADLTTVTAGQLSHEVKDSRSLLQSQGWNVGNFIYPYGSTNATVKAAVVAAGYGAARATGAASLSGGGYAAIDARRKLEIGCALPLATTTLTNWKAYVNNTKFELEDLFVVDADPGANVSITREIFLKSSYGAVYTGDAGDAVSVKVFVVKPGKYDLTFRVKTGYQGGALTSATNHQYKVNGVVKAYTQAGPTVLENQWIVWGYHKIAGVQLAKGWVTLQITSLEDWAMLLDWVQMTWKAD
ncbi:MAG: hypothetical protein EXR79_08690 [Myxococcales bacterium]|nr:hypothetical protein [Myxococcales bacterium]